MASFIPPALLTLNSNRAYPQKSVLSVRHPTFRACLPHSDSFAPARVEPETRRSQPETPSDFNGAHFEENQSAFDGHEQVAFSGSAAGLAHEPATPAEVNLQDSSDKVGVQDGPDVDAEAEDQDDWYEIFDQIGKADTYNITKKPSPGIVNLAQLDGLGREALASASYDTVVDIDIDRGGVLPDDDDNNDLFCGVGLEAIVDTPELLENMRTELGIETATHVQLAAIPRIMDGKDIVVQSHTGTGKTLAFLLPMLDAIEVDLHRPQGIVVAPTRELAMQIYREIEKLVKGLDMNVMSLIGGANPTRQVDKLRKQQPHVVVGTPGRLAEMHEHNELRLHSAKMMVVDEVDQSIGDAFVEDIAYLLSHCPRNVQKVLVSATSDVDAVRAFATKHLYRPVLLRVGGAQRLPKQIEHWYSVVPARMRIELLRKLMNTDPPPTRAMAFVDEPRRVDMVAERLFQMKIPCGSLRGDAHKLERAEVLTAFRKGRVPLLVTTEVAARGLDIPEVTHVFNLDLPTDGDHYVHRAGRCGRVRNAGTVVSFATAETAFVIGRLEKQLGVDMVRMEPRGGKYVKVAGRGEKIDGAVDATRRNSRNGVRSINRSDRGNVRGMDGVEDLVQEPQNRRGGKGRSSNENEEEKKRVKLRWRDSKNKGKRRVPRSHEEEDQVDKRSGEQIASGRNEQVKVKVKGHSGKSMKGQQSPDVSRVSSSGRPRPARSLKVRAKQEGWVGNR
eukprot:GFKZ01002349.1.p1 GENE.GFKZ01002349.1~~GFKZ01002349.1.p1  ORF type:complete len:729 (+),score=93.41 GFKZ01002349.1:210-2396(+)